MVYRTPILIAGAGVGGLTAAMSLALRGVEVVVFERAEALTEVGAGIQLSPNALRPLFALGLEDALRAHAFEPEHAAIRYGKTGGYAVRTALKGACQTRYGAPYFHIHRADLLAVLLDAVRAARIPVHLDARVETVEQSADGATLILTDGTRHAGAAVIGADGIHSAALPFVTPAPPPTFSGQIAWRGLVPASALPAGLIPPDATAWVGPGKHLVTYYVRGGSWVNFVAVEERATWTAESWTTPGDLADLRAAFADWHDDVQTLLAAAEESHVWGLFEREPLETFSKGRVALLGDAAHPSLPFLAQGAAMAIEDAAVLASCLNGEFDVQEALIVYSARRQPRTRDIQARARANADRFHLRGLKSRLELGLSPYLFPGTRALRLFDDIYGYEV